MNKENLNKPEKSSFSVVKLPGYNYHNQAGYDHEISIETVSFLKVDEGQQYSEITKVSQIIAQDDFLCVVISAISSNSLGEKASVICKAHDLNKKWTEVFRSQEENTILRIGYSSNQELFILEGGEDSADDSDFVKMDIINFVEVNN